MRSISITQERSDEVNRNRGRTGGRNSKKSETVSEQKAARAQILIDDTTVRGASMRGADVVYFDDIILGCGSFEEPLNQGPVYLDEDPFVYGEGQFFLKQDCPLIGAGFGYIDENPPLIGKTTDINSFPDSDITDIGFHYPNWNYVNAGDGNALAADLDGNMKVDFKDFAIFANCWQQSTSEEADLDGSGFVDYNDLAILAGQWLRAIEPDIQIQIYGDANDGYVEVGASGYSSDTQQIFLLADGQYAGEICGFENGDILGIDVSKYGGGDDAAAIERFGIKNFATLCIVSEVKLEHGAPETTVSAQKSPHKKCQRCWNYWPSVGSDSNHPDLCERCVSVISKVGA